MDSIELKVWANNGHLTEIFQSSVIMFAHVNNKYEQVHQPCKCRDFLGDLMWSRQTGKEVSIYGMKYDFSENPYDTEVMRLSLKFPTKTGLHIFINHFPYLNEIEEKAGVSPSIILNTDQDKTIIIEGDKIWQSNVWKLSLYTFYMKVMSYNNMADLKDPEKGYRGQLTPYYEDKLLSNLKTEFKHLEKDLSMNHNNSGFISVINLHKNRLSEYVKTHQTNYVAYKIAKEIFGDTW